MKNSKFIQNDLTIEYKKQLKVFQKVINPDKFTDKEIEKIKQDILSKRGV